MTGNRWNPDQYLRFSDHRLRPALELLARVPLASPRQVCDLGCGTGNVTQIIAQRWPNAKVTGVDNSASMLSEARQSSAETSWVEADVETWEPPDNPDLIFSNAVLHWIGHHDLLFPRLLGTLADGGCLAVQMPMSDELPSHQLIRETLAHCVGTEAAEKIRHRVGDAADYEAILAPLVSDLDIWTTEYPQKLSGDDAVFEWVRGTVLLPILAGLADDTREEFIAVYRQRLREAYPRGDDGLTLYPFRRLFIIACR